MGTAAKILLGLATGNPLTIIVAGSIFAVRKVLTDAELREANIKSILGPPAGILNLLGADLDIGRNLTSHEALVDANSHPPPIGPARDC